LENMFKSVHGIRYAVRVIKVFNRFMVFPYELYL
jgi:hypothetical protein